MTSRTPDSAIRTPEELAESIFFRLVAETPDDYENEKEAARDHDIKIIAAAIRAERARKPEPSKSFEELERKYNLLMNFVERLKCGFGGMFGDEAKEPAEDAYNLIPEFIEQLEKDLNDISVGDWWKDTFERGVMAERARIIAALPNDVEIIKIWRNYLNKTIDKEGSYEYDHVHSILEVFRLVRDRLGVGEKGEGT